jgi:hypothetical protein
LYECKFGLYRYVGHVARMGEVINAYNIFIGSSKGKKHLRRPKNTWEDNIKIDSKEVGCMGVDSMLFG